MPKRTSSKSGHDSGRKPKSARSTSQCKERLVHGLTGGTTPLSQWLEEIQDPDFLEEGLRWFGLEYILPFPEICLSLNRHLLEKDHNVWASLIHWVERNRPRRRRGRRAKGGKKERAIQLRAQKKSWSEVGKDLYPGEPLDVAKHKAERLVKGNKPRHRGLTIEELRAKMSKPPGPAN
jgi:hypothetical protein